METPADARVFARVKRFRERWVGDDRIRAAVLADPAAVAVAAGIELEQAPGPTLASFGSAFAAGSPEARANWRIDARGQAYLDFCADDDGARPAYRKWRARQRARAAFSQGIFIAPMGLHLPFAVELTRGCSLGCWFCGLSASPLAGVLPTDLDTWEEMLRALERVFGASAVRGFLYWATDPLDHPDYEAYGQVFARRFGRFPATTTAAALVDVGRTRRLMALARDEDCPSLRFSVVSRRLLDEVLATFSAEELADIDLVQVNRESLLGLAEAGHVRRKVERWPERVDHERRKLRLLGDPDIYAHRTIACVSGFLIEPVVGRVRLISPEPCSERWPDGFVVFDEARFRDAGEFAQAIDAMVARHMGPDLPAELALLRGVSVRARGRNAVEATARGHRLTYMTQQRGLDHLPALADAFRGGAPVEDVVRRVAHRFALDPGRVRRDTTDLWRGGVLIETLFAFADTDTDTDTGADLDVDAEPERKTEAAMDAGSGDAPPAAPGALPMTGPAFLREAER